MGRLLKIPILVPAALAAGYVVLLITRFPRLVAWENGNSDMASAYVLADAVSHGHTGHVVMSNQAGWVPLWYGLITHGLSFHRVLWEISPALLLLASAALIGWAVARVCTRAAGLLTVALIVAASPSDLVTFTAPVYHNLAIPGAALLGAYLVWLSTRPHPSKRALAVSSIVLTLVVGTFLASDQLVGVVGIVPFAAVALVGWWWIRDRRLLLSASGVVVGSVVVAVITSHVMHGLHFSANSPHLGFTRRFIPQHLKWLGQGLLRLGNGLSVAPHSAARTPLVVAAACATVAGLVAMCWLAGRALTRRTTSEPGRARDLHVSFWAISALCAAAAYVVTTVASQPTTERYFAVAVPAVAATVPMLLGRPRASWVVATGASIFIAASIVSLAADDEHNVFYRGSDLQWAAKIESLVRSQHLGIGYAGYWDATGLDWVTHERLHVYPVTDKFGPVEPMYENRVNAWYRPRPGIPSYLILAPGDDNLRNAIPASLPRPAREFRLGAITIAAYGSDIAAYLRPPTAHPSAA